MKKKKILAVVSGVSVMTVCFLAFQNFTVKDSSCPDDLCKEILYAIKRARVQEVGLTNSQIIEHAANRFGYGVSPVGNITPIMADENKVAFIASVLSQEARQPMLLPQAFRELAPAFSYQDDSFGINVITDSSADIWAEYSHAWNAYLKIDGVRKQAEGKVSREELQALNVQVRAARKAFQHLFKQNGRLHQRLAVTRALVGSQRINAQGPYDRQVNLREVLQEFWFNHFNVKTTKIDRWLGGNDGYENVIHQKMYTTFEQLLSSVITHPAMLAYLDNHNNRIVAVENPDGSVSRIASNQNLGREILELHTLGIGPQAVGTARSPYTQKDVEESSRILAGVNVDGGNFVFNELKALKSSEYCVKEVCKKEVPVVMGVPYDYPGIKRLHQLVRNLANHPSTKKNLCSKLVSRFVTPLAGRVELRDKCIEKWGDGGDLKEIYATILSYPGTWSTNNYRRLFKNPYELAVSQLRAKGIALSELVKDPGYAKHVGDVLIDHSKKLGINPRMIEPPTGYEQSGNRWVAGGYFAQAVTLSFNASYVAEMFDRRESKEILPSNFRKIASNDLQNKTFDSVAIMYHRLLESSIIGLSWKQKQGMVEILENPENYSCSVPYDGKECSIYSVEKTASDLTTSQLSFMKR